MLEYIEACLDVALLSLEIQLDRRACGGYKYNVMRLACGSFSIDSIPKESIHYLRLLYLFFSLHYSILRIMGSACYNCSPWTSGSHSMSLEMIIAQLVSYSQSRIHHTFNLRVPLSDVFPVTNRGLPKNPSLRFTEEQCQEMPDKNNTKGLSDPTYQRPHDTSPTPLQSIPAFYSHTR